MKFLQTFILIAFAINLSYCDSDTIVLKVFEHLYGKNAFNERADNGTAVNPATVCPTIDVQLQINELEQSQLNESITTLTDEIEKLQNTIDLLNSFKATFEVQSPSSPQLDVVQNLINQCVMLLEIKNATLASNRNQIANLINVYQLFVNFKNIYCISSSSDSGSVSSSSSIESSSPIIESSSPIIESSSSIIDSSVLSSSPSVEESSSMPSSESISPSVIESSLPIVELSSLSIASSIPSLESSSSLIESSSLIIESSSSIIESSSSIIDSSVLSSSPSVEESSSMPSSESISPSVIESSLPIVESSSLSIASSIPSLESSSLIIESSILSNIVPISPSIELSSPSEIQSSLPSSSKHYQNPEPNIDICNYTIALYHGCEYIKHVIQHSQMNIGLMV
ncbi:hypothetical protein PVAND_015183 [Polypedilum vanderplanki]|uniref:Uncharacterized protein n=1 Tax=Polypedilum vanderplanki TaxID=319348 RepID=A0A9J6BC90_POLVA|nr:hypothetical protein PVAND_015183 [Polypedilum vanderplanki]